MAKEIPMSIDVGDGWYVTRIHVDGYSPITLVEFERGAKVMRSRLDLGKRRYIDSAPSGATLTAAIWAVGAAIVNAR